MFYWITDLKKNSQGYLYDEDLLYWTHERVLELQLYIERSPLQLFSWYFFKSFYRKAFKQGFFPEESNKQYSQHMSL